jgi:hypothetical protein
MTTKLPSDKLLSFEYKIRDDQFQIIEVCYKDMNITQFVFDYCSNKVNDWQEELLRNN